MLKRNDYRALVLSAALGLWAAPHAFGAYTLNTLATFNGTNGQSPDAGLTLSGSTLYGTTLYGGASGDGTVFSVPLAGGSPTTLVTFNNTNGAEPNSVLTLSGSTLYGTTEQGGASGYGAVFSVPLAGGSPKTLATFNNTNGASPRAGLTLSGNTLYGTTYEGGTSGDGTVFSLPLAGGSPMTLATFKNTKGANPVAGLTLSGSTLYGTTYFGGAGGYGTVFSVPLAGGSPTTLATFNGSNGALPQAGLTLSGSTLYGTTSAGGGANGYGTVFSVPLAGGSPTALATFDYYTNGANPAAGLTLSGNTLYGTTEFGGANGYGTVFSVPLAGGSPTTLATFNGTNGADPVAGLTLSGNTLYGTTVNGGASGDGTVFSVSTIPNPIISLTAAAPTAFGSQVGTLTVTGGSGSYNAASASFSATPTGYLAVSGFNPSTDSETYALNITDSVPGNLAADLADAVSEINAAAYTGYGVAAATADPTGEFGSGYDFYITITNDTLGTGSPYFGFDFTQLNNTTDTLSVNGAAAVPEPASLSLLAGGMILLGRRAHRRASVSLGELRRTC